MEFKKWLIKEADWQGDFSDVQKTCLNPDDLVNYLNSVRSNYGKKTAEREKFPASMPFIHSRSDLFKDGDLDIDDFAKRMNEPPKTIVNTNEKILKSGGPNEFVYKTGIPAFRGIVYDKNEGKFYVINTCPGAGQCVVICYARHGRYIQYAEAYDSMTRRLNFLINHPDKYEEQLYSELKSKCEEHKAYQGYKPKILLRWNDSGDFFTKKYKQIAENVIKRLNEENYNIESYAYTKLADVAKDASFQTTFSSGANTTQTGQVDFASKKLSIVVPKDLFRDLDLMKISDEQKLKERVAKHFVLPISHVLTYGEMMATPKDETQKWHVIITPGDGDDAAFRKDVKTILLTQH